MTTLRAIGAALALVGLAVAAYLVYARYAHVPLACATGGCETVQSSPYAELLGVPVAVLGLVGYATLIVLALLPGEAARAAAAALALGGLLFSTYLVVVQAAVIHALCQWCLASDAVMTALAGVSVLALAAPSGRR